MIKLLQTIVLLSLCVNAFCGGVRGSYLEWQPVPNVNGQYKIRLTLYLDETSGLINYEKQNCYLFQNDKHWESTGQWQYFGIIPLERTSSTKIDHDTTICSNSEKSGIFLNIYENTLAIPDLSQFSFNQGYGVAWHNPTGHREGKDVNFSNAGLQTEWVTTFIPPLTIDGVNVENSSPSIGDLGTFVLCKDQFATIQLSATDRDGDNLRYKLFKPYGIHFNQQLSGYDDIYDVELTWSNGYSDQNQMHGNPGLGIDHNTGLITVRPSDEGQYFIGISVEEYRNGKKLGCVSFYYTLVVVDCNEQETWDKSIYKDTTAVQTLTICQGVEVTIASKQAFIDPQPGFQWTRNGKIIWGANSQSLTLSQEGEYQLLTTDIDGCPDAFDSEIVQVNIISSGVEMDSIPPVCTTGGQPIMLKATPPGGTFTGPGVVGITFDPRIAGAGKHEIQYAIDGSEACSTSIAKREAVVSEAPVLDLMDVLYGPRGKPISIGVKDSLNLAYQWMPPNYLNNVAYANPISTPIANITYTVTATNEYGCTASRKVKIIITERVLIPDAFTPNNDGINETWELKGVEGYPDCRVTIYNRWGEVIFHSVGYKSPFDGTVAGALQMPGIYAYRIQLTENSPELTGSVTLIR
jgi:gliding motility-associated-like protein